MEGKNNNWSISYSQLGLLVLTFSLGFIVALLMANSEGSSLTSFSTTELIGFVLSVILSGASIVLAVSAIVLGKSSELAVIKRSDESIKLQNEVFVRTTDALQRIESSTGVTEKRIEDIISGRVGDLSHQLADELSQNSVKGRSSNEELEGKIREIIQNVISPKNDLSEEEREKRRKFIERRQKKVEKYKKIHHQLLLSIINKTQSKIERFEHGSSSKSGDELFDAIYSDSKGRHAISTFIDEISVDDTFDFISKAAPLLKQDQITDLTLILFRTTEKAIKEAESEIQKKLVLISDELSKKLHIKVLPLDEDVIDSDITSLHLAKDDDSSGH